MEMDDKAAAKIAFNDCLQTLETLKGDMKEERYEDYKKDIEQRLMKLGE